MFEENKSFFEELQKIFQSVPWNSNNWYKKEGYELSFDGYQPTNYNLKNYLQYIYIYIYKNTPISSFIRWLRYYAIILKTLRPVSIIVRNVIL